MRDAVELTQRLILSSEIPRHHPAKEDIERCLSATLVGLLGEWRITVVCSCTGDWWVLGVEGSRFKWTTVLADPAEQSAAVMSARLLDALRDAKVLS